eukprot:3368012-Rhodomonas_salina.2
MPGTVPSLWCYALATQCPVLRPRTVLPASVIYLRAHCPSIQVAAPYRPTQLRRDVRYWHSLRADQLCSYAMCSTEPAYGATMSGTKLVLSQRMVQPDYTASPRVAGRALRMSRMPPSGLWH